MQYLRDQVADAWSVIVTLLARSAQSLRDNLGVGVLALGISAVLWVGISLEQNPPRTDLFSEPIPVRAVNVPPDLFVFGSIPSIRVRVTAPVDVWERMNVRDFVATVDLSGATVGTSDFLPTVTSTDNRIRVVNYAPQDIPIRLEVSESRVVPVRVEVTGNPPLGFVAEPATSSIQEVLVQGPRSLVDQVTVATASVDIENRRINVNQTYPLTPRNSLGFEIAGVNIEPAQTLVQLTIRQQVFYRTVPVIPVLEGQPAQGYSVGSVSIEPQTVTLVGNQQDLEATDRVQTRPISVAGARTNILATVQLALPPGISQAGNQAVTLRIQVVPIAAQRQFDLVPIVTPADLPATLNVDRVRVILAGPEPVLAAIDPASLRLSLDVAGLAPGQHRVSPRLAVPPDVRIASFFPDTILVTIPEPPAIQPPAPGPQAAPPPGTITP